MRIGPIVSPVVAVRALLSRVAGNWACYSRDRNHILLAIDQPACSLPIANYNCYLMPSSEAAVHLILASIRGHLEVDIYHMHHFDNILTDKNTYTQENLIIYTSKLKT